MSDQPPTVDSTRKKLEEYCAKYRGSELPDISISGLYDLYPDRDGADCDYQWPEDWPSVSAPGVYLIADSELQTLYIGKASMSLPMAGRLAVGFRAGEDGKCVVLNRDSWKGQPRYVAVIAMEEAFGFEAPALEEFLITRLQPIDNKVGSRRKAKQS